MEAQELNSSTSTSSPLSKNKITPPPSPLRFILASSIQMSTVTLGPGQLGQLVTRRLDPAESENKTGQGKEIAKLSVKLMIYFCRENVADAKGNGEKCARLRIIEMAETINCNLACNIPGIFLIIMTRNVSLYLQWTVKLGFGDRGPPVLLLAVEGRKKGQGDIYLEQTEKMESNCNLPIPPHPI